MICELGRSTEFLKEVCETSSEKQELANGLMEVGLIDSTRRTGKPSTWGSGQQRSDGQMTMLMHRNQGCNMVSKFELIAERARQDKG